MVVAGRGRRSEAVAGRGCRSEVVAGGGRRSEVTGRGRCSVGVAGRSCVAALHVDRYNESIALSQLAWRRLGLLLRRACSIAAMRVNPAPTVTTCAFACELTSPCS